MSGQEYGQTRLISGIDNQPRNSQRAEVGSDVIFRGFDNEQARWVRDRINSLGLPIRNLRSVVYIPQTERNRDILGHANLGNGELALYKSLDNLPERAQLGTIAHEMAHHNDPFTRKNVELYGGMENMARAAQHASAISEQTLRTRVFLNPYHKALVDRFENGMITRELLDMETHAIMLELRMGGNRAHLEQVQDAQLNKLRRLARTSGFTMQYTRILSANTNEKAVGVDRTLNVLMGRRHDADATALEAHINRVVADFDEKRSPLGHSK